MSERLLSALSMARGAGKLSIGYDASREAVEAGAPLAVLAADASPRTAAGVRAFCEGRCPLVRLAETQDDIAAKFGRRFAVAAVTDGSFAALVRKNLDIPQEERE